MTKISRCLLVTLLGVAMQGCQSIYESQHLYLSPSTTKVAVADRHRLLVGEQARDTNSSSGATVGVSVPIDPAGRSRLPFYMQLVAVDLLPEMCSSIAQRPKIAKAGIEFELHRVALPQSKIKKALQFEPWPDPLDPETVTSICRQHGAQSLLVLEWIRINVTDEGERAGWLKTHEKGYDRLTVQMFTSFGYRIYDAGTGEAYDKNVMQDVRFRTFLEPRDSGESERERNLEELGEEVVASHAVLVESLLQIGEGH